MMMVVITIIVLTLTIIMIIDVKLNSVGGDLRSRQPQ